MPLAMAQPCATGMRHLEAKLPNYPVVELQRNRDAIVPDDAKDGMVATREMAVALACMANHAR